MLIRRFQSARKRKSCMQKALLFHYFVRDSKENSGCTKAPYEQVRSCSCIFSKCERITCHRSFSHLKVQRMVGKWNKLKQNATLLHFHLACFTFTLCLLFFCCFFFKQTETFWIALNYWNDCLTIGQNWEQEVGPFCRQIDPSRHNKQ